MNPFDPMFWRNFATVFFFLFFCGVIVWAFRAHRARRFQHDASLPLEEGTPVQSASPDRHD